MNRQRVIEKIETPTVSAGHNIESRVDGIEIAMRPSNDAGIALASDDDARASDKLLIVPANRAIRAIDADRTVLAVFGFQRLAVGEFNQVAEQLHFPPLRNRAKG